MYRCVKEKFDVHHCYYVSVKVDQSVGVTRGLEDVTFHFLFGNQEFLK